MQTFKTAFCAEHYTNTETILDPLFRLYCPSAKRTGKSVENKKQKVLWLFLLKFDFRGM